MGIIASLFSKGKQSQELRMRTREELSFSLFPNLKITYILNLNQQYKQSVQKKDTNSWEVDLQNGQTQNVLTKFHREQTTKQQSQKKRINSYKEGKNQAAQKDILDKLEENIQRETQEKNLRKLQAKIKGLHNKLVSMRMTVEKQNDQLKRMQTKRDKIAFECSITQQMVNQEAKQLEKNRDYKFQFISNHYKLSQEKKTKRVSKSTRKTKLPQTIQRSEQTRLSEVQSQHQDYPIEPTSQRGESHMLIVNFKKTPNNSGQSSALLGKYLQNNKNSLATRLSNTFSFEQKEQS